MINTVGGLGGLINRPGLQALRQRKGPDFDSLDKNGDGSLDKSELLQLTTQVAKNTGTAVDNENVFTILDADKDGAVGKEEFHLGKDKARGMMGLLPGKSGKKPGDFSDLLLNMLNEDEEETEITKLLRTGVVSPDFLRNSVMSNYSLNSQQEYDVTKPLDLLA